MRKGNLKKILALFICFLVICENSFASEGTSESIETTETSISLPSDMVEGHVSTSFKGRTVTNLIGSEGDFEDGIGDWYAPTSKSKVEITSDESFLSDNAMEISIEDTSVAVAARLFVTDVVDFDGDTNYFLSAYIKQDAWNTIKIQGEFLGGTTATPISDGVTDVYTWVRTGVKISKSKISGNETGTIDIEVIGDADSVEDKIYIDGVMLVEITDDEYDNLSVDELLEKYSYVSDTKATQSFRVRSVGKNLFDYRDISQYSSSKIDVNSDSEYINISSGSRYTGITIDVKSNTDYTFSWYGHIENDEGTGGFFIRDEGGSTPVITNFYNSGTDDIDTYKTKTFNTGNNSAIQLWTWVNNDADIVQVKNVQLEEGDTATDYEPYEESLQYISLPGEIDGLYSLPNGVSDEISVINNKLYVIKKTYTDIEGDSLQESDIYQLEEPKLYELNATPLTGFENGTIFIEPVVQSIAMYDDGIGIDNTDLLIEKIESISKIDGDDIIPIDISDVDIASDNKSFTIDGAVDDEIYQYTYYYQGELTTVPTISYSVALDEASQEEGEQLIDNKQSDLINQLLYRISNLEEKMNENRVNVGPFTINCTEDTPFDLVVSSSNSKDFSSKKFTVIYDSDDIELVDLCTTTSEYETSECNVGDISFTEVESGVIEFIINKPVDDSESWQGAINVIKFMSLDGCTETTITYTVE